MRTTRRCAALLALLPLVAVAPGGIARSEGDASDDVAALAAELDALTLEVDGHVTTLTSPFFEGRSPGTDGSLRAKDYAEFFLRQAGLEPAFEGGYRQPFGIPGPTRVVRHALSVGDASFVPEREFTALGLGTSGTVEGELVLCGYGIRRGPDDYASFPEGTDLTGKIAVVLRFEPRNERGQSRWSQDGAWTGRAALASKVRACAQEGAVAVIVANPPGAADPRARKLMDPAEGGRGGARVPVLHVTTETATKLLALAGEDLVARAAEADERGVVVPLGVTARVDVEVERTELPAANLGALLPGVGDLAEELVVVGAHLDHVGNGRFASPATGGPLHPGADDNASGSAALLAIAQRMAGAAAFRDTAAPRRTVLFLLFDAEESGLLGSRHYCEAPIRPLERHALMVNLDMVGRIPEGRVNVQGASTAEGLEAWLTPHLDAATVFGLAPQRIDGISGRSDHASFVQRGVSALFFTNGAGHPDYHRPSDTADKVETRALAGLVALVARVTEAAALRPEPFVHVPAEIGGDAR